MTSGVKGFLERARPDETQPERQRYHGKSCRRRFNDVTETILLVLMNLCGSGFCVCTSWDSTSRTTTWLKHSTATKTMYIR